MPKKVPEWLNDDIKEFYDPNDVNIRAIQRAILEKRGQEIAYMTITDRMKRLGLERPRDRAKQTKEPPMGRDETPVEVLPGQMNIDDSNTLGEVYTDAVGEFDALPDGYAKTIQPMREYTEAEEFALNESMRLFGFVGAIVRDQYGRILDGNQRQRVARLRGLAVPYTITHVRDEGHAIAMATSLNAVRRQYPRAEREQIALVMRDQGFSYRVIAAALGVSKDTVQRDIFGGFNIIPAPEPDAEIVSHETIPGDTHEPTVSHETISPVTHESPDRAPAPVTRVKRKGGGTYPAQRPTAPKPKAHAPTPQVLPRKEVQDYLMSYLKVLSDAEAWNVLATLWIGIESYWRTRSTITPENLTQQLNELNQLIPLFPAATAESFQLGKEPHEVEGVDGHTATEELPGKEAR